ncbi:hypothetical protein [Allokutzneria albata]|nr:hypothetical protein [Allokutzneria albata]
MIALVVACTATTVEPVASAAAEVEQVLRAAGAREIRRGGPAPRPHATS